MFGVDYATKQNSNSCGRFYPIVPFYPTIKTIIGLKPVLIKPKIIPSKGIGIGEGAKIAKRTRRI